jgi:hypothetical protein
VTRRLGVWVGGILVSLTGTETKVATINEALRSFAVWKQAKEIVAALDSVEMNVDKSDASWAYAGGRDLSRLAEDARGSSAA